MTRSLLLPLAFTLLAAPLLGGGLCGVRFQKSPVPESEAKADPALFGTWVAEKAGASAHEDGSDADRLQVFESDGARTVFMMSAGRFRVESNTIDTMTLLGHPFATATHRYLALRAATIRQDDVGDPARASASGDVTIVRYRIVDNTLHIDLLHDDTSIAAVTSRAMRGTYVKAAKGQIAEDQLRIDDAPAAVLKWLDTGAKWTPYDYTFRRASIPAPSSGKKKATKARARE